MLYMVVLFLPFSNALKLSKLKELSEAPNHQKKVFNEMITGWLQSCSDSKKGKEPCGKYFDFSHRGAGTREYVHIVTRNRKCMSCALALCIHNPAGADADLSKVCTHWYVH